MNNTMGEWIRGNPEVGDWLSSVSESTRPLYARRLYDFFEWLTTEGEFQGYSPPQVLDYQDKATGRDKVKIANRLSTFVSGKAMELRPKTLTHYYSTTRSFFAFHGCDLPRRGFSLPDGFKEPAPQNLDYPKLVKIISATKPRDRAIITIMFQAGFGWREFAQFNKSWDQVKSQLEAGQDHLIIELTGRKKARGLSQGFKTIVGRDGVNQLREYLKIRGEPKPGEPIFLRQNRNRSDQPLGPVAPTGRAIRADFERLARRVTLIGEKVKLSNTVRYGISLHQLRDVLKTQWAQTKADKTVIDYLLGHQVDPNDYLKFGSVEKYLLQEYRKAEPMISPLSNPTPDKVDLSEVESLQHRIKELEAGKSSEVEDLRVEVRELKELVYKLAKEP